MFFFSSNSQFNEHRVCKTFATFLQLINNEKLGELMTLKTYVQYKVSSHLASETPSKFKFKAAAQFSRHSTLLTLH